MLPCCSRTTEKYSMTTTRKTTSKLGGNIFFILAFLNAFMFSKKFKKWHSVGLWMKLSVEGGQKYNFKTPLQTSKVFLSRHPNSSILVSTHAFWNPLSYIMFPVFYFLSSSDSFSSSHCERPSYYSQRSARYLISKFIDIFISSIVVNDFILQKVCKFYQRFGIRAVAQRTLRFVVCGFVLCVVLIFNAFRLYWMLKVIFLLNIAKLSHFKSWTVTFTCFERIGPFIVHFLMKNKTTTIQVCQMLTSVLQVFLMLHNLNSSNITFMSVSTLNQIPFSKMESDLVTKGLFFTLIERIYWFIRRLRYQRELQYYLIKEFELGMYLNQRHKEISENVNKIYDRLVAVTKDYTHLQKTVFKLVRSSSLDLILIPLLTSFPYPLQISFVFLVEGVGTTSKSCQDVQ